MSLKREDAMTHAPDLLLLSQYDPELGEVAAFEELIGSHGGLGGSADRAVHPPPGRSGSSTRRSRSARRRSTATSGAGWRRSGSSWASHRRRRPFRKQRSPRRRSPRPPDRGSSSLMARVPARSREDGPSGGAGPRSPAERRPGVGAPRRRGGRGFRSASRSCRSFARCSPRSGDGWAPARRRRRRRISQQPSWIGSASSATRR